VIGALRRDVALRCYKTGAGNIDSPEAPCLIDLAVFMFTSDLWVVDPPCSLYVLVR